MSVFISNALAESVTSSSPSQGGGISQILILLAFIVIFYLLLWRPQAKRAKEHRQLMANLAVGDEISTSGGIIGKITALSDNVITLKVADGVEIKMQKAAVASVLPKGTM